MHIYFQDYGSDVGMKSSASLVTRRSEDRIPRLLNAFHRFTTLSVVEGGFPSMSEAAGDLCLKQIFNSLHDAVIATDLNGHIVLANARVLEMAGTGESRIIGHHFKDLELISRQDLPRILRTFAQFFTGQQPRMRLKLKTRAGREIPVEATASLIRSPGNAWRIVVFLRNVEPEEKRVHELKRLVNRLRRARSRGDHPLRLISLCSHCRRARTESDGWEQLEVYLSRRSETRFSHGICPDCLTSHFPELAERVSRRWEMVENCRRSTTASPDNDENAENG